MVHWKTSKRSKARTMLRLADLEQSRKCGSPLTRCSEFARIIRSCHRRIHRVVLLRTTTELQSNCGSSLPVLSRTENLAASTINVRLAAVRHLAYEASDGGLLSPDLAAGVRRVKGAKRLGVRIGNWLTTNAGRRAARLGAQLHGSCYLERPSTWMNRSTSKASTPRAIAAVGNCERDFRWTTINRPDRSGKARRNERSGAAMDGRTVFPALASTNHRLELGRGTRKSTSKPC